MGRIILEVREAYPGSWEWVIWEELPGVEEWYELMHGCDYASEEIAKSIGEKALSGFTRRSKSPCEIVP